MYLHLWGNQLRGSIPEGWAQSLPRLQQLTLLSASGKGSCCTLLTPNLSSYHADCRSLASGNVCLLSSTCRMSGQLRGFIPNSEAGSLPHLRNPGSAQCYRHLFERALWLHLSLLMALLCLPHTQDMTLPFLRCTLQPARLCICLGPSKACHTVQILTQFCEVLAPVVQHSAISIRCILAPPRILVGLLTGY